VTTSSIDDSEYRSFRGGGEMSEGEAGDLRDPSKFQTLVWS
jgi:hypothetical protein